MFTLTRSRYRRQFALVYLLTPGTLKTKAAIQTPVVAIFSARVVSTSASTHSNIAWGTPPPPILLGTAPTVLADNKKSCSSFFSVPAVRTEAANAASTETLSPPYPPLKQIFFFGTAAITPPNPPNPPPFLWTHPENIPYFHFLFLPPLFSLSRMIFSYAFNCAPNISRPSPPPPPYSSNWGEVRMIPLSFSGRVLGLQIYTTRLHLHQNGRVIVTGCRIGRLVSVNIYNL